MNKTPTVETGDGNAPRVYWWNGRTLLVHSRFGCGRRRQLGYNLVKPSAISFTDQQLEDSNFRRCKRCSNFSAKLTNPTHEEIEDARAEAMIEAREEYEDQPRLYDDEP